MQTYQRQGSILSYLDEIAESIRNKRLADIFRPIDFIANESYGPHNHLRLEINYVTTGYCYLNLEGKRMKFSKNDIMLIPSFVEHKFVAGSKGCKLMQLEFMPEIFNLLQADIDPDSSIPALSSCNDVIRISNNKKINDVITKIIEELMNKDVLHTQLIMLHYAELLLLIYRHLINNTQPSDNDTLNSAIGLMRASITEPIDIIMLSKQLHISDRYLRQLFSKHLKTTPIEFINNERIKLATQLLKDEKLSIKEVAYKCGFKSPQYFTRIFKKQRGISPRYYTSIQ